MKQIANAEGVIKKTILAIGINSLRAIPYVIGINVFVCIPVGLLAGPVAFAIASFVCTVAAGIWFGRKLRREQHGPPPGSGN